MKQKWRHEVYSFIHSKNTNILPVHQACFMCHHHLLPGLLQNLQLVCLPLPLSGLSPIVHVALKRILGSRSDDVAFCSELALASLLRIKPNS